MNKTILDQFSPLLLIGIMVLLAASAAWYAWSLFTPSPTDISANDAEAIARYKEWLKNNDLPFVGGKIKPADLPGVYRKVIEHDIKTGDLKSARSFIAQTIQKKLDATVLEGTTLPEAKELIRQMQIAQRKLELLKQIVTAVQQKELKLPKLADEFCQIPFNAATCPEQAEEMSILYRANLRPLKDRDQAVQKVVGEIEKWQLPSNKTG
jgi:hypothetical protein